MLWYQGRASSTRTHTHTSHLIIYVVLVGVVLVKNQLKKLSHGIHINRLELPGFAACLFIITERDVAERRAMTDGLATEPSHTHEPHRARTESLGPFWGQAPIDAPEKSFPPEMQLWLNSTDVGTLPVKRANS